MIETSGHLPECPKSDSPHTRMVHVPFPVCICPALRACEARIDRAWHEYDQLAREGAYLSGLSAARDAVAALQSMTGLLGKADALAAIDALRGESNE